MKLKNAIEEYYKMIYHISLEYLRNKEDAEDIVQEVFLRYVTYVHEEEKSFTSKEHEKYWIVRVTINLCCNELKTSRRKTNTNLDATKAKSYIMPDNELFDEIQKLGDNYKNVFILHYLEDFKISEISEILDISENNVKTRLKRAREKLKSGLNIEE